MICAQRNQRRDVPYEMGSHAGAHEDVPNNLLECGGNRGKHSAVRGVGPASMPLPRSAWARRLGADRRFALGVANLSDQLSEHVS